MTHLYKEAVLWECAMQVYFSTYNIQPLTLGYEDYIKDFKSTIEKVLNYLDIDPKGITINDFYYKKLATRNSEIWVDKFAHELQKEMNVSIW